MVFISLRNFSPYVPPAPPDDRFSKQVGWSEESTYIANAEITLGLTHQGGHQHRLDADNQMQTINIDEWYTTQFIDISDPPHTPQIWRSPYELWGMETHILNYNKTDGEFKHSIEAGDWIKTEHNAGRHHTYIIGNEPDLGYDSGGTDMTPAQWALMHKTAADLIRANCGSDAFIITAGWADGLGWVVPYNPRYDMGVFLSTYYGIYGTPLDADAIGWHTYQWGTPGHPFDDSHPVDKLIEFSAKAIEWNETNHWTRTNNLVLTEFGWNSNGVDETPENTASFMTWFIPYLKANPQVLRWHWWHVYGASYLTGSNGTTITNPLGMNYKTLAHN